MPESPGNIEEIHNSLKASLGRGHSDLDQDVVAASKRVLLENISFQPASSPYSMQRDVLRTKYIPLNPTARDGNGWPAGEVPQKQWQQSATVMTSPAGGEKNGDCLPSPKVVLYPEERVKMEWTRMTRIGAGLVNMGNTCFFNSTLQCLTYTAPLVNYCFTNDHREKCKKKDFCMMCEIQNHIKSSLDCGGRSIKPHSILQKLRCIAKHMKWGRQEDAHEFLRFVVDHLQQACLNGETKLDRFSKETTVINQIFGGYLRSQVTCLRCQAKSDTFDPFMDLSLDIKGVNTVEEALAKFVKPETLENENAYKCPKCKNKVRAQKRFSIEKAPNVLTLQLNRFDFHHHLSGKINRFIKYPEKINLRNYMSQRQGEPILYHLYGVLVHSGHSSEHGHYYSFVRSPSKTWYCMNDSIVHQAGSNSVFSADAYVLFYARINKNSSSNSIGGAPSLSVNNLNHVKSTIPEKKAFIGPTLPNHFKPDSHLVNGIHGKPSSEIGTPIKHPQPGPSNLVSRVGTNISSIMSNATTLAGTHNKISFPILTPLQKKQQQHLLQQQQQQKDDGKRIVLQIKHGNSTTMEKSPDGKSKVVNGDVNKQQMVGLVPYNDDSDSEQENAGHQKSKYFVDKKTDQQESSKISPSHQAAGDYHHNQTHVQKPSFPSFNGDSGSRNVVKDSGNLSGKKSVAGHQDSSGSAKSHVDIPPPDASAQHQPTSKIQPSNMQTQQASAQLQQLHAANKNFNCKDSLSLPPKPDARRDLSLMCTTTPATPVTGKGSVTELPVVNMSSYADSGCAKVKATGGSWHVQTQDCAPSPRSSCSSSNSVNSTTEWTVESKGVSGASKCIIAKVPEPNKDCVKTPLCSASTVNDKPSASNNKNNAAKPEIVKLKDSQLTQPPSYECADSADDRPARKFSQHSDSERPSTPVDISDKRPLLQSPGSSGVSDGGLRKEKKHKKRHKKDSELWGFEKLRDDSSSRSDSSSKKKKKHKKDKEKKKHKRSDSYSSDSDYHEDKKGTKKYSKHKYSHLHSDSSVCSDEDRRKSRKRETDSDESDGYEWVEKIIETPARDTSSKISGRAPAQSWNHHVKDDVAPRKETSTDKVKSTWDGSRTSKFAATLDGTSYSFGNSVVSWDGRKNHIDREVEEEERARKKRHWSDDYNEEIDAGKTKKVKMNRQETSFSSENPFQRFQSMTVKSDQHRENGSSWSQDHSYHQHHYHSLPHHHRMSNNSYHSLNKYSNNRFKSYKLHNSTY